jgi:predicted ATPase with chaperone activity
MSTTTSPLAEINVLETLLSSDSFVPSIPNSIEECGIAATTVEGLVMKYLLQLGARSGRNIAQRLCLPFGILESLLDKMKTRRILVHTGHALLNDYLYALTETGINRAKSAYKSCSYVGPCPVPLEDYINSVEAQSVRAETPRQEDLRRAFADISVEADMMEVLGPAVNSGAGLFLYGAAGNGKTTLARQMTRCFSQDIWIPHVVVEDGQFVKLYDPAYHVEVESEGPQLERDNDHDTRWIRIRRPLVVVGGELTMIDLEIRHDPTSNICEAPLQMKSNCGCLLIDDFGRQRIQPDELLNRWIVPLEERCDFLTLPTGKKIQVPFDQLIIFSTNLNPSDLADDAFLRRLPYEIEVHDPKPPEFHKLFSAMCRKHGCQYRKEAVDYLMDKHYRPSGRPFRRCHPRDLIIQIRNLCAYHNRPLELQPAYIDRAVKSYFAAFSGT